jgi:hypothetical protein
MGESTEKFITVILSQGKGEALLRALNEKKVLRVSLSTARAPFFLTKKKRGFKRTVTRSLEKDVLTVLAGAEEAEDLFAFIYENVGMGRRYGGFMFMGPLARLSPFALPADVPQES